MPLSAGGHRRALAAWLGPSFISASAPYIQGIRGTRQISGWS